MPSSSKTFRVAIVEDHQIFIDGLLMLFKKLNELNVVGVYRCASDLFDDIAENTPDLIFMDIYMPYTNGFDATKKILAQYPQIKIIALTNSNDGYDVENMLQAGAIGYLTKDISIVEIKKALEKMAINEIYISPEAALNHAFKAPVSIGDFTIREMEILKAMESGKKEQEMANVLQVSVKTIQNDKKSIADKLGVNTSNQILVSAIRYKIL